MWQEPRLYHPRRLRALIDAMPIANGLLKPPNILISSRRNWRPCFQREVPMRGNARRRTLSSRAGEGIRVRGEQSGWRGRTVRRLIDKERILAVRRDAERSRKKSYCFDPP